MQHYVLQTDWVGGRGMSGAVGHVEARARCL